MTNDNKDQQQSNTSNEQAQNQEPQRVQNPFEPNNNKPISQEDIDNEQKLKEAMSERD
ncbi:hypothetical protein [Segetibacter sp. 3557_3]|uniref:hypothetical protein n=1 Tax=Segetibacter sp. 3557_3 TaxID=2547429 RepID=UPI0014045194|nr:hypothetical protein [Segetibacter sp. 3557_3]